MEMRTTDAMDILEKYESRMRNKEYSMFLLEHEETIELTNALKRVRDALRTRMES